MSEISVSICCLTYNHCKFIKDALDGFLKQVTNFKYEIVIYDDCSTDGTQDILREYAKKNSSLFRLYLSEVNNYKNDSGRMFVKYLLPHARGKYIALCEGDDFWIDPFKLQKQYDVMESNADCSISFHDAKICDMNGDIIRQSQMVTNKYYKYTLGRYSCEEILQLDFYPTASIFFRKKYLDNNIPDYFYNRTCGDLPIRITLGALGNSYCINDSMSAYRIGNPNSASGKVIRNTKAIWKTLEGHIEILKSFDEWSNRRYHATVLEVIFKKKKMQYIMTGDISSLHGLRKYTSVSLKEWVKCVIMHYCPDLYWNIRK